MHYSTLPSFISCTIMEFYVTSLALDNWGQKYSQTLGNKPNPSIPIIFDRFTFKFLKNRPAWRRPNKNEKGIYMYPYVTRMLLVCIRMLLLCIRKYPYVAVCYSYVTRMYPCGVLVKILLKRLFFFSVILPWFKINQTFPGDFGCGLCVRIKFHQWSHISHSQFFCQMVSTPGF